MRTVSLVEPTSWRSAWMFVLLCVRLHPYPAEPGGAGRHSKGVTSHPSTTPVLIVFVRAFRTPDLRKKLLFTGAIIALFRLGAKLPAPGISERNVNYCSGTSSSGGVFAILNLLSGNSLLHLTVFAIGILPYITASIILQMLNPVTWPWR